MKHATVDILYAFLIGAFLFALLIIATEAAASWISAGRRV